MKATAPAPGLLSATAALLLSLAAAPALAQLPPPADSSKNAERQRVSLLKYAALQQLRDLLARDLSTEYPAESRVSVYLDIDADKFVLHQATLYIDERQPVVRNYSLREAGALLRHSAHRVLRDNFEPGAHHLRIEFSGQKRGAKPGDPTLHGSLELDFEAEPAPQAFVLPVAPDALSPGASFFGPSKPKAWQWDEQAEDPRLALVRFLRDIGLEFASMIELLEIAGPRAASADLPLGYHPLLAHAYLDLGMREQAVAEMQQAAARESQAEFTQTTGQTLPDAWLRLAKLDYQRGDYARALYTLDTLDLTLTRAQRLLWQDIKSRILLAQGDYTQAAEVLARANETLDDGGDDVYLPYLQSLYLRHNYALALIKSGRVAEGRTLLDRLGTVENPTPAEQAVRDQANLGLAYNLLRDAQGAAAKAVFQRLPMGGTYANNALLGLGWTELAPPGKQLEKVSPGTFGDRWALGDFVQASLEDNETARLRRALVSWDVLAERNPDDAAVQEALVVLPFALEKLGQRQQAGKAYESAVTKLTQSRRKLAQDIESLRQGLEIRALLFRYAASGLPYTRWTDDVRTSNPIVEHVQNFHDFQRLQGALLPSREPDAALLKKALSYAAVAQMRAAQTVIAEALEQQLDRIDKYRTTALVGLTRYYDWDPQEDQPELPDLEPLEASAARTIPGRRDY